MRKLLITLLLLMPLCASATGTPFSDVPPNFPYAQAITNLASNGVISGYSDGTFRPENPINRAEFTKIVTLYKFGADMVEKCGSHMQFSDLLFDAWYGKYICRAKDAHLIDGYPDGTFRPAQNINFSEAAKIIALTATLNAGDPILPSDDGGPWYSRYVRFLSEAHAIPTSIKSLDQVITRGEMAEMIWRLKDTQRNLPSNTYNNLTKQHQTYTNTNESIQFQYPATYRIITDGIQQKFSSGKNWYRIDLSDPESPAKPSLRVEVNPDGYGPDGADAILSVIENGDGSLHIVDTKKLQDHNSDIRTVVVKPFIASNGNTYTFSFSFNTKMNVEPDFFDVLNSVRISNGSLPQTPQKSIYSNHGDGFQFTYPSDMAVTRLRDNVLVDLKNGIFTQGSVLAFPSRLSEGTNLQNASVNVATVPCNALPSGTTISINGVDFQTWFAADDAQLGNGTEVSTYATMRHGKCYYMALEWNYRRMDTYSGLPKAPPEFDRQTFEYIFTQIINSFTFVDQGTTSILPSNDLLYRNSLYGFTIELPAGTKFLGDNGTASFQIPILIPGTNLTEKTLTISEITSSTCSDANLGGGPSKPSQLVLINNISFLRQEGGDVGAGQIYNSTNYGIVRNGLCITFSFVLHAFNPDIPDVRPPVYDPQKESAVFEEILRSLTFE